MSTATATPTANGAARIKPGGRFKKATRQQLKLRLAIDGPSGAGKTYTALTFAHALAKGGPIAVIDSESGSARKYAGENGWEFDALELDSFSPSEYASAIEEAGRLGYPVIVVDSLSHAWEGKDGALELKDKKGGNSFAAWKDITPMHRRMIDAILTSPAHVICTMRSKTEYVLETDSNGKQVPKKVGMAPVQRAGMEYEFDIYLSMDWSHIATVTKSRCRAVDGQIFAKPSAAFVHQIQSWLEAGEVAELPPPPARISDAQLQAVAAACNALGWKVGRVERELPGKFACTGVADLTQAQADELLRWLDGQRKVAESKAAAAAAKTAPSTTAPTTVAQQPVPTTKVDAAPVPPETVAAIVPPSTDPSDGMIRREQADAIVALRDRLMERHGFTADDYRAALVKRGKTSAKEFTVEEADEFIAALQAGLKKREEAAGTFAQPDAPPAEAGQSPN